MASQPTSRQKDGHKKALLTLGFQTPCKDVLGPQNIPKTPPQEVFWKTRVRETMGFHKPLYNKAAISGGGWGRLTRLAMI